MKLCNTQLGRISPLSKKRKIGASGGLYSGKKVVAKAHNVIWKRLYTNEARKKKKGLNYTGQRHSIVSNRKKRD